MLIAGTFSLVAGLLLGGEAVASEARQTAKPVLYVCEDSALLRRAIKQEHGSVEFVTAEAVAEGRVAADGKARCITEHQVWRLSRIRAAPRVAETRTLARR